MSDAPEYTLRWRGRQSGPYPVSEINRLLDDHKIGMGHEILCEDQWVTLEQFFSNQQKAAAAPIPRLMPATPTIPLAPMAPQLRERPSPVRVKVSVTPMAEAAPVEGRPRYRLVFALLAVFIGFIGLHNFYARQWLTGVLQILLSVATVLMGFGIIASMLWAMAEALLVRKDGHGIEMI